MSTSSVVVHGVLCICFVKSASFIEPQASFWVYLECCNRATLVVYIERPRNCKLTHIGRATNSHIGSFARSFYVS